MAGGLERHPTEHFLPVATPQIINTASRDPGGSHTSSDRTPTSRSTIGRSATPSNSTGRRVTRRPVTRSAARSTPTIEGASLITGGKG